MDNEQFKPIENQLAGHIVTSSGIPFHSEQIIL